MAISKEHIKRIRKLHRKKFRREEGKFVVERWKNIRSFLDRAWEPVEILAVHPPEFPLPGGVVWQQISPDELSRISALQHPYDALAVFRLPEEEALPRSGMILALDGVADPGNLGTIIRSADWFGVRHIVCGAGTVDAYNPKTVQAAMGSLARVKVHYADLGDYLASVSAVTVGADMEGENVFDFAWPENTVLVMGNEGHGFSPGVRKHLQRMVSIPKDRNAAAESLNVSTATAVILAEWFRHR